jgi:hypothetical protein
MDLKETGFLAVEDIKSNVIAELQKIPTESFRHCLEQDQDR